jgi:hypothetical protein
MSFEACPYFWAKVIVLGVLVLIPFVIPTLVTFLNTSTSTPNAAEAVVVITVLAITAASVYLFMVTNDVVLPVLMFMLAISLMVHSRVRPAPPPSSSSAPLVPPPPPPLPAPPVAIDDDEEDGEVHIIDEVQRVRVPSLVEPDDTTESQYQQRLPDIVMQDVCDFKDYMKYFRTATDDIQPYGGSSSYSTFAVDP